MIVSKIISSFCNSNRGRQSNIELLRIVAMLLVLIVHIDFISIGPPTIADCHNNVISALLRYFFQSCAIGCVDIFVLISGWFGINPSAKGFFNFIFQCLFFLIGVYAVFVIAGFKSFIISDLAAQLLFIQDYDYWFIKAFILLYILSPVLNKFCEKTSEKEFRYVVISYYLIQSVYGWGFIAINSYAGGYSTMSFIGLYLLARYFKLHGNKLTQQPIWIDITIILAIVVFNTITSFGTAYIGHPLAGKICDSYISPLVIVYSLYMVILFSKLNMQSTVVNWIASSAFAVYLLHTHIYVFNDFFKLCT